MIFFSFSESEDSESDVSPEDEFSPSDDDDDDDPEVLSDSDPEPDAELDSDSDSLLFLSSIIFFLSSSNDSSFEAGSGTVSSINLLLFFGFFNSSVFEGLFK